MFGGLLILFGIGLALLVLIGAAVTAHVLVHPPRRTEGVAIARGEPTNPAEAGAPSYCTQRLTTRDGHVIELWDVPGERPDGPVIVMLHGWGDGRLGELLWLDVLRPLASKLILFDLRAHGECAHRRCAWGVVEVQDALAVIEAARGTSPAGGDQSPFCEGASKTGTDPAVVLFGYSMGAAIAMLAGACAKGKVAGIIADSPYRSIGHAVRGTMGINRLPAWPVAPLALAWLRLRGAVPREDDVLRVAQQLSAPLLVLHGEDDRVAAFVEAERIAQAAPRGRFAAFAGCDHLQAACAAPEQYRQTVEAWLRDVAAEHAAAMG